MSDIPGLNSAHLQFGHPVAGELVTVAELARSQELVNCIQNEFTPSSNLCISGFKPLGARRGGSGWGHSLRAADGKEPSSLALGDSLAEVAVRVSPSWTFSGSMYLAKAGNQGNHPVGQLLLGKPKGKPAILQGARTILF